MCGFTLTRSAGNRVHKHMHVFAADGSAERIAVFSTRLSKTFARNRILGEDPTGVVSGLRSVGQG